MWEVEQSVGHQSDSLLLLYLDVKQSISGKLRPQKKQCGWNCYYKNLTLLVRLTTGDPSTHPAIYSVIIHCDNQGAIALGKNPQAYARSKHINIQWHYQREEIEDRIVQLRYIPTNQKITDGLTKPLSKDKFLAFWNAVGLE